GAMNEATRHEAGFGRWSRDACDAVTEPGIRCTVDARARSSLPPCGRRSGHRRRRAGASLGEVLHGGWCGAIEAGEPTSGRVRWPDEQEHRRTAGKTLRTPRSSLDRPLDQAGRLPCWLLELDYWN